MTCQAYKFVFTSPSSALDIECQEDVDEHVPSSRKRSRRSQKAPTRGHVANLLGMKAVTARSLAYVAVQVRFFLASIWIHDTIGHQLRFALSNAGAWNENDGCFNYVTFYNNITDYFELDFGPENQAHTTTLLAWWTRLVTFQPLFIAIVIDGWFKSERRSKIFGRRLVHSDHVRGQSGVGGSSVARLASQRTARERTRVSA